MDEGRVRATVALLLSAEERLRIQQSLQDLDTILAKLEEAPGRRLTQYKARAKLRSLERKLEKCEAALTHNQRRNLVDIKAVHFFSHLMITEILQLGIAAPAALRRLIRATLADRTKFLSALHVLQNHFDTHEEYPVWSCATLVY